MFINSRLAGDVDAPRQEYAHHVLYKNKPGAAERGPAIQQIESALADYFPCSFANRPFFGEIVAAVMGLERPYVRNLDNPRKFDETSEFEGEVHDRGEIWSGAFWELRSLLGRELADRLLAQAWKSMAWPIAEQDTTRNFIDALLLSARKIASDQQVAQITTALRTRRFPMPG
jgi:hypothetical protein